MKFRVGDIVCLTTNSVLGMITFIGNVIAVHWADGGKAYWYPQDALVYLIVVQTASDCGRINS